MIIKPKSKIVKISEIELNNGQVEGLPTNPRTISNEKFNKLVTSIKDFPEMMNIRPIVVDENMVILGGNMRYRACKVAGLKEVPILIAESLTIEQKREFLVKDNVSGGDWDWDQIEDKWDLVELDHWGLDLDINDKIDNSKEGDDIEIPKSLQIIPKKEYILIMADEDSIEWEELKTIFKCKIVRMGGCRIGGSSDKVGKGLERVFSVDEFKKRVLNEL